MSAGCWRPALCPASFWASTLTRVREERPCPAGPPRRDRSDAIAVLVCLDSCRSRPARPVPSALTFAHAGAPAAVPSPPTNAQGTPSVPAWKEARFEAKRRKDQAEPHLVLSVIFQHRHFLGSIYKKERKRRLQLKVSPSGSFLYTGQVRLMTATSHSLSSVSKVEIQKRRRSFQSER